MNKVVTLTKVLLKNTDNKFTANSKKKSAKLGMLVLIVYIAGIFGYLSYNIIDMLIAVNQPIIFIGILLVAIAALIVFQTIFTSINIFYMSKDIEHLLPLPIKPKELLMAKFNTLLITEYIVEGLFTLVPIIIYGILTTAGIMFYIYALAVLILFPILPAAIASLIVMIIMTFSKFTKNKDKFTIIATAIAIILAVGIQYISMSNAEMTDEQMIQNFMKLNGMVELVGKYFVTIKPSLEALTNYGSILGILSIGKLIGLTAVSYILFILVGNRLYLKGAVGIASGMGNAKGKKIREEKEYKQKGVRLAYVEKEMKILFKNPIFFMQCVLPAMIMPIIMGVYAFIALKGEQAQEFTNQLNTFNSVTVCIILGVMNFFNMMIYIAVTAISRDGQNAKFMKYIPIPLYKQVRYKIIPAVLINIIPIVMCAGVAMYLFNGNILEIIIVTIIATILAIMESYAMVIVDLKRPKLEWDTEYAVVKQNVNMFFQIIFVAVTMGIIVYLAQVLKEVSVPISLSAMFIVTLIPTIILDRVIKKKENKLFEKII